MNLPYGIKRIGVDAFGACGRLTILDIPSSVESIGEMAFANSALKKLDLRKNRITEVSNRLVYGCWQLSEIYLPETVVIIGDEAFAFIPVTSIVLPSALQQIGMNPFRYCNRLQSLSFSSPSERFSIVYPFLLDMETDSAICCVGQASGSIEVPAIRAIGDYCCTGCEQITNIVIPDTVSYIGKEAFSFCINLETVRIGKTKNLEIRDCAFEECYNLSLFSVEGDVISIGQDAFREPVKKSL